MADPKVYIFWDNSNIFIEGRKLADIRDAPGEKPALRIDFDNLFRLAKAGRIVGGGIAAGSIPPEHEEMWKKFQGATPDLHFDLQERGAITGKEQGVDHVLQTYMLRAGYDNKDSGPQIAVLLTGDGKGYEEGVGFHADLQRLRSDGWGIEVLAWERSCKYALKKWAKEIGVFVPLEDFYESITFISGGRYTSNLTLIHRKKALPTAVGPQETSPDNAKEERIIRNKERKRKKALRRSQLVAQPKKRNKKKKN